VWRSPSPGLPTIQAVPGRLLFAQRGTPSGNGTGLGRSLTGPVGPVTLAVRVLARRKPLLLLRFDGVLLLRLAARTLVLVLFHEPPRNTRFALSFRPRLGVHVTTGGGRSVVIGLLALGVQ
jgi:hypothetical protein